MKLNRILVPLDGSTLAEAALRKAVDLAAEDDATISLLRAAEAYTRLGDPVDAQVMAVREAEGYLAAVAQRLRRRGCRRIEIHVGYGPAAAVIVEAATAQKADLIVMSTHGRSGLRRLILGSVTESVLRGTTIPILIVHPESGLVNIPVRSRPAREAAHV